MQDFLTPDVDLAAFLVCRGHTLQGVRPPAPGSFPRHAEFAFVDDASVASHVALWLQISSKCDVDARAFSKARVRLYRLAKQAVELAA